MSFWIPTKPFTLPEAFARLAAATGSIHQAMVAQSADYNGHRLALSWNDYRQYYVGEYWWAGRHVITRGCRTLEEALPSMIEAYDRGGKGTVLFVHPRSDMVQAQNRKQCEADWKFAQSHSRLMPHSQKIQEEHDATWRTWQFDRITEALSWEKNVGVPLQLFLEAASSEEWASKRKAFLDARRQR